MPNTKAPSNYSHGGDIWNHPAAVDFSANLHPLGMPPEVAEALRASVEEAVNYPDPFCTQLRRAIAHGQGVEAEEVICGAGAADLIYRLCLTLRPQNALVTAPTFSEYAQALALTGCTPRRFLLHPENQFDLGEDFLNALTPELNMVFLCTPNNPTGRCVPLPLLRRIADRCEDIGAHLVLDECFIRLTDCPSALELLRDRPHLFLLRAFTKTYAMAGLRLGYGLSIDGGLLLGGVHRGPDRGAGRLHLPPLGGAGPRPPPGGAPPACPRPAGLGAHRVGGGGQLPAVPRRLYRPAGAASEKGYSDPCLCRLRRFRTGLL